MENNLHYAGKLTASKSCLGIVGEVDDGGDGHYVWTHKKFDIGFNENYIVDVNLTSEAKVKLKPGIKIPFTYEVRDLFSSL